MMKRSTGTRRLKDARVGFSAFMEPGEMPRWKLQDAKAQFSHLVRLAAAGAPQCVSVRGADSVVLVSYDDLMEAVRPEGSLLDFFRASPLVGVEIEIGRLPGSVREVDL